LSYAGAFLIIADKPSKIKGSLALSQFPYIYMAPFLCLFYRFGHGLVT